MYQYIPSDNTIPSVQFYNYVRKLKENLTIPLHKKFFPTCLQLLLVNIVCLQE